MTTRTYRLTGLACAILAACCGCQGNKQLAQIEASYGLLLYVSPTGNDQHNGHAAQATAAGADGPFATLERARDEIRAIKAAGGLPPGGVCVILLAGRHERQTPFVLGEDDSGTAAAPICYRALPGAAVHLSGGRLVAGLAPVSDDALRQRLPPAARDHVRQLDLAAVGISGIGDYAVNPEHAVQLRIARADMQGEYTMGSIPPRQDDPLPERMELFWNDRPMEIARGPNADHVTVAEPLGENTRNVRGFISHVEGIFRYDGDYPQRWAGEPDAYVCGSWARDWAEQRHRIDKHDLAQRIISVAKPYHTYGYAKNKWFYGFNILAELDQPGEWYVDRASNTLLFWPPADADGATRLELSAAPRLIELTGVKHLSIRGIILEAARASAITMRDCVDCHVVGCTIRNVGCHAVVIEDGRDNSVAGCDLYNLGGGGVYLVGGDRKTLTPCNHAAINNHIHHYGRWDRMYRPAVALSGVGMRVAHNLIHDAPHAAIIFGGNDHVIEFNEIHSVCYESNDCGAIYAGRCWAIRGHVIRNNYLHHINGRKGLPCKGIYLDDSFAAAEVVGNVFHQVTFPIFLGGGRDNLFANNLFIDCPSSIYIDARALGWQKPHVDGRIKEAREKGTLRGIRFQEPPYSTRYPQLLTLLDDEPFYPKGNVITGNIFWRGNGEHITRMTHGQPISDRWWLVIDSKDPHVKEVITVENNLVDQDPRCVNAATGDFALRDDSPAQSIGFKPIPFAQIGLVNDDTRASWPALHRPRVMPAPPTPMRLILANTPPPAAKKSLRSGPPPVLTVPKTTSAPAIDGAITSAEWPTDGTCAIMPLDKSLYHEPVKFTSTAWLRHDGKALYIAVANDTDPQKPLVTDKRWAGSDAVEIALRFLREDEAEPQPTIVLRAYPNGRFESSGEARAPADLIQAAQRLCTVATAVASPSRWNAEFSVPLALFSDALAPNPRIACNISARKIADDSWAMWQGTGALTWETDKAGILDLAP
ncbi:right-handed parallel beta-helix repeat-containing protein [Oligosphaera ethanolica]|uniref:Right handed beta helix domain-containing protein n=1 Tax=Oligosphaera ethanolica TaxID=760260 RepID=A0AAE3VGJ3_9BACT|nr:right-handed parallel beta-helix repeat-containing protein [Oligosphaera ethanolica]MDQ0290129.1 hypothetical protein [Oligosphaera ethanolica]